MNIKLYDRVLLKSGYFASVVEIFNGGKAFIADVDKNGDTFTEEITVDEIERVI